LRNRKEPPQKPKCDAGRQRADIPSKRGMRRRAGNITAPRTGRAGNGLGKPQRLRSARHYPGLRETEGELRVSRVALAALSLLVLLLCAVPCAAGKATAQTSTYYQVRLTVPQGQASYLSLRRLKLFAQGRLGEKVTYYVQGIYKLGNRSATDGRPYLQEARVSCPCCSGKLTLGQFKPPFGLERFTPDYRLETIDRARVTESLVPTGKLNRGKTFVRDLGVQWETDPSAPLRLAVGVFTGYGANSRVVRVCPLCAARLLWTAHEEGERRITLGASFCTRNAPDIDFSRALPGTGALGYDHFCGSDRRWGVQAAADWRKTHLCGEYLCGEFRPRKAGMRAVRASGYYVQASREVGRRVRLVVKHEMFDPDGAVRNRHDARWTTVGVNWRLSGEGERLQVNYVFRREAGAPVADDALLVQYQRFF